MSPLEIERALDDALIDIGEALELGQFGSLLEFYEAVADEEELRDYAPWSSVLLGAGSIMVH